MRKEERCWGFSLISLLWGGAFRTTKKERLSTQRNMLDDLCVLHGASHGKGVISPNTKADLLIWLGFLLDIDIWLPIPSEP